MAEGLIGSTFVLCGLRYAPDRIEALYRDLSMTLEDSTTYQLILNRGITQWQAQGALAEARNLLVRQGRKRSGPAEAAVAAVADLERLGRMAERLFDASGWDDLLATP